jgi:RNA polymerase sigma-70 factor (ECF subfamily)
MQSTPKTLASAGLRRDAGGSSDAALVQRVKQGERSAFDLLVAKYQHKILNLVMRYVKDPSEAMDVAQEAFIKAYRAVPNFRGDSAFYTWLYRIAINTAKNHLVAARRRPLSLEAELPESDGFEPFAALRDLDTPERLALTDEIGEAVLSAVEDLPDELRTAILLREIEGMSYEEIAVAMDCPVGTVRSRIFRAREAIDKRIQELM